MSADAYETPAWDELRGTIVLPVRGSGASAGVAWDPALRLPGLRPGEAVRRREGSRPRRASILAADGMRLDADPLGASIAGTPGPPPMGLQRLYDARLGGHPSKVAVAVMLVGAGFGGTAAAPIARAVLQAALHR